MRFSEGGLALLRRRQEVTALKQKRHLKSYSIARHNQSRIDKSILIYCSRVRQRRVRIAQRDRDDGLSLTNSDAGGTITLPALPTLCFLAGLLKFVRVDGVGVKLV